MPTDITDRDSNQLEYITSEHIEHSLQHIATIVYHTTEVDDLKRFTSHYLKVGTCLCYTAYG